MSRLCPWLAAWALGAGLLAGSLPQARGDAARGERVFQHCYACHSVVAGETDPPGPNLLGVLGRRAGVLPGFGYSPAMKAAGATRRLVWTRKTLDAFLANPQRVVPDTTMGMPGLPDARDRRDVIDYLAEAARAARTAPRK